MRTAPILKHKRHDIGRVGPKVWAKIFAHLCLGQFREIFDELALRIPPGEIGITLVETGFGQRLHHLWSGERFGKKNRVRIFLAYAFDQILPKSDWFGVWIVHTKDAHPALGPKQNDALHLRPERSEEHTSELQSPDHLVC